MSHPNTHSTPWPSTTGKGWTGVTPSSFDGFFPKLSTEIRLMIWSFCSSAEPRLIELQPNPDCDEIVTYNKTPGYLQACHESRFEGLKVYERLGSQAIRIPTHTIVGGAWSGFTLGAYWSTSRSIPSFSRLNYSQHVKLLPWSQRDCRSSMTNYEDWVSIFGVVWRTLPYIGTSSYAARWKNFIWYAMTILDHRYLVNQTTQD